MLDVDTREKKKRGGEAKMKRCVYERYDRGGVERGQRNKQGSMEEEANQLYRRPHMMGQARDEEEDYFRLSRLTLQMFSRQRSYTAVDMYSINK